MTTVYVNDLPSVPQHSSAHCYVDDTKLLVSFPLQDQERPQSVINEDLQRIRNWCFDNRNQLINPGKTKLMICGSGQMVAKLDDFCLKLLGEELTPVKCAKDLGVTLDSHLTYNNHVQVQFPHVCLAWVRSTESSIVSTDTP